MNTTFAALKKAGACTDRYRHLAKTLGGIRKYGRTTPITALQILDANGVDDCLWAARLMPNDRLWRHFAADCCAERVLPIYERDYPSDDRPRKAIEAARLYADGLVSLSELETAWAAAWAAARAAARAAAWAAARDAAGAAAWAAAGAAVRDAAWAAAGAAERNWQSTRLRWYLTECEWGPRQGANP